MKGPFSSKESREKQVADGDAELTASWSETSSQYPPASRGGAVLFSVTVFVLAFLLAFALLYAVFQQATLIGIAVALAAGWLAMSAFHIVMNWEKVCVTRLGVFHRIAGPGLVCTIPVVDQIAMRVDQRVIATPFCAERTLTSDLVPVDVDAILLWVVWDAKKACLEVNDYSKTVSFVAQTAMREAIGRASLARVALQRDQIDRELKDMIDKEVSQWGIDIIAVKVRDIVIPQALQDAMSAEAQATRLREARLVLADAEKEISDMLAEAAGTYDESEAAMKLRTLHLLSETVKQSNGAVVTVPSSFSDGLGDSVSDQLAKALGSKM